MSPEVISYHQESERINSYLKERWGVENTSKIAPVVVHLFDREKVQNTFHLPAIKLEHLNGSRVSDNKFRVGGLAFDLDIMCGPSEGVVALVAKKQNLERCDVSLYSSQKKEVSGNVIIWPNPKQIFPAEGFNHVEIVVANVAVLLDRKTNKLYDISVSDFRKPRVGLSASQFQAAKWIRDEEYFDDRLIYKLLRS